MANYTTIADFDCGAPLHCTIQQLVSSEPQRRSSFALYMVLSGICQVSAGDDFFTAQTDDVFSIEANTVRSFSGASCVLITVEFNQPYFERSLPEPRHPEFLCNSAVLGDAPAYDQIRRLIARLIKNNAENRPGYELRNWSMIYSLMDVMYRNFKVEDSEARNRNAHRYTARMAEISTIINENYQENLTLSELSNRVHLSAPYLSKFFEKQFGVTFLSYLTSVRLSHSIDELLRTNNTIEAISANAGFPNSHSFVQAFKKEYGMLPSIYRRSKRSQPSYLSAPPQVEQHDYMAGLRKYLDTPQKNETAQTVSCRVSVDAKSGAAQLRHNWKRIVTVTSASAVLLSDIQDMLRRVQREIGFTYVKFNGIVSDDMRVYSEDAVGQPVYSFVYVDKVFDFLLSIGLRPFVQLGFMPELLAKSRKKLFGYLISEPVSVEKWRALIAALMEHLRTRYGAEELRRWRFSVWHQPDTPESMYGFADTGTFCRFYAETYRAVKACDPGIPFGSPATYYIVQKDYKNWYIPFLGWCREHGCEPDFLNFNYYDTVFTDDYNGRETFGFTHSLSLRETPDGFSDFVTQVISERHSLSADSLPIYLTEWNNTPSQQDLLNDTCFKSCYIAKGILENYDRLDSFGFWSLTDWMGEAPQPGELFFGGTGLFTANGIPKASYYAFTLLSQLGDTLLGKGDGWFITRNRDSYRILLYNYRHFSHLYAHGERFDMTFTDRYTPFEPEQMLDVQLTLRGAEGGAYLVTETMLSRSSGSAFDQWIAMGALELTALTELETLAARSTPAISKYVAHAENNTLRLDAMLDMLEVRLIVVKELHA